MENSRLVDRLRFDAYHDALTRLPNRRRVLAQLEEAVRVRAPGEVVAVLSFDIDGLRDVNDAFGHDAGDQVVREVATRLRGLAPAAALVGRSGSDEFLVTLRLPDAAAAVALASSLRDAVQQPLRVGETMLEVNVTVGVAVHPDHGSEPEVLVRRADLAAQEAKQFSHAGPPLPRTACRPAPRCGWTSPPTCVGRWTTTRSRSTSSQSSRCPTAAWSASSAWPGGSTRPTARCRRVTSWRSPSRPGQLGRITDLVLREGLRRARAWRDAGRELPVAVNLSFRTVVDPTFPRPLAATARGGAGARQPDHAGDPRGQHGGRARAVAGHTCAGWRSWAYGWRWTTSAPATPRCPTCGGYPFHEVKIDRSFVQGMVDERRRPRHRARRGRASPSTSAWSRSPRAWRTNGPSTCSRSSGCGVGQGFLFSRALPFDRFEAWLAAQTTPAVAVVEPRSRADARRWSMATRRTRP